MDRPRKIFYLACALVVVASAVARGWFASREMILDEAWVANSVLVPDLSTMFFYPEWLQTTPPLFLLWLRWTVQTFGLSRMSLEMPAAIAGVGGVLGVYWIGRTVFEREWRWLAVALTALSPSAVFYASACKQYAGELLVSTLLLIVVFAGHGKSWAIRFGMLLGTGIFAVLMSHGSLFLFPGIALWLLVSPEGGPRSQRLRWLAALAVGVSAVFATEYLLYIRPNTNDELRHFWHAVNPHTLRETWIQANGYLFAVANHFYHAEENHGWRTTQVIGGLGALIYGVGSWAMLRHGIEARWQFVRSVLLWELPVVLLVISDVAGVFPFSLRTSLFLIPCLVFSLVQRLAHMASPASRDWRQAMVAVAMVGLAVIPFLNRQREESTEQSSVAYAALQKLAQPDDLIYVHRSMQQQFELEWRLQGPVAGHIVFGTTGPGCCARGPLPPASTEFSVNHDLQSVTAEQPKRIWSYHTLRKDLWLYLGLDEPKVADSFLRTHGYHANYQSHLHMVSIDGYERDTAP